MARQYWRPSNMLYPVPPVMISCADEEGRSNIMTAAWAGTICSDPVMVSVSIRPERYSHDVIERTGEFVINLTTGDLTRAADFCGVRSGRDVDKFEYLHLTKLPSRCVKAPSIGESPVCLECVVSAIERLGTHDLFIAKVVAVSVDEQYLDEKGRFALEDADLTAYVHGAYFSLGRQIGTFGYSVRKKETRTEKAGKTGKRVPAGSGGDSSGKPGNLGKAGNPGQSGKAGNPGKIGIKGGRTTASDRRSGARKAADPSDRRRIKTEKNGRR
ncbi:MAG: flavin reductase [Eubacteriales bacterium]|nr:flavin reductase [Eubacteriales bacterium]